LAKATLQRFLQRNILQNVDEKDIVIRLMIV